MIPPLKAQYRTQGRTAQHGTQHRAAATKTARQKWGQGGAATDGEQPPARRKARKRDKRTESREAEGQQRKQRTAPRPRAPGAGNQRKKETTGAHKGRRGGKKKKHQGTKQERRKPRDTKTEGGGGETTKEQPTAKRETQTRRERTKSQAVGGREKRPKHSAEATRNGKGSERGGGNPSPEQKDIAAKGKGEAHHNAPGRPARPTRPQRASTRTPAAVRMDECAPGGYPAPAGYEQPPSRWTSARPEGTQPLPATNSRRLDGRVCARRVLSPCRLR